MSSSENPPAAPASEQSQPKQPDAPSHVVHTSPKQEAPTDAQSKQDGKKKGGSGWGIVIGIFLVGLALGVGYYLYHERHNESNQILRRQEKDEQH